MTETDIVETESTVETHIRWGKEDRVRWIEWRVRELTIKAGNYVDERGRWLLQEKAAGGRTLVAGDIVADYAVWLLKERDGLSWHQIAFRFFPAATEQNIGQYILRVRRTHNRVEKRHPGSEKFTSLRLSEDAKILMQAVICGAIPIYVISDRDSDQLPG